MSTDAPLRVLVTVYFTEDLIARLGAVSPRYEILHRPTRLASDIAADTWAKADILYLAHVLPEGPLPSLKWVQSHYAGVDNLLYAPFLKDKTEVVITSTVGIHATNIAEYVLGMFLRFGHKMPQMMKAQAAREWSEERFERFLPLELRGSTVGIVGYGAIGREIARLVRAFGGRVLACKRDAKTPEEGEVFRLEGTGDPDGQYFERLYPPQALATMVKDCHFVVITTPLTPATRGLYSRKVFEAMKDGSYLVNVGRGGVVDEVALLEALRSGKLAGAAFDVFEQEPLPPDHPLWTAPNLIITPHICGNHRDYSAKAAQVFEENLRRYIEGKPLLNRVNREAGY
jgi:phosphoglycerate dehydrogenase-like enzyme